MTAKGFTLLEVLVALAVLGSVLATVFGVFSTGLRSISEGDERLTLALIAESLLNRADLDLTRSEMEVTGVMPDGVRWRVSKRPYQAAQARQGLVIEEQPRRAPREEDLLPPEDGERRREAGEGREEPGFGRRSAATGRDEQEPGAGRFGAGEGSPFRRGTDDAEGERRPAGAGAARLKAWLLTAEVGNGRGRSFTLSRLSLEGTRTGEAGRPEQGLGRSDGRPR